MNLQRVYKVILPLIMLVFILDSSGPPPAAEAGFLPVPILNIFSVTVGSIGALNRRNRIYVEAGTTTAELNAYYDNLLSRMKPSEMGAQYWRLKSQLEAERHAVIKAAEEFKKGARSQFHGEMRDIAVNQLVGSKGGTKILSEVRDTLLNTKLAALTVVNALDQGQLTDNLISKVQENLILFPGLQDQVAQLGSALSDRINDALGGIPHKIEQLSAELQQSMLGAIDTIDQLDGFVVQTMENSRTPFSITTGSNATNVAVIGDGGMGNVLNNTVNNVMGMLQAADASGKPPQISGQIRQTIRNAILAGIIKDLEGAAASAMQAECETVTRAEYVAAIGQLGKAPETAADEAKAIYKICRFRETGEIIHAYMIGVSAEADSETKTADSAETETEEETEEDTQETVPFDVSACLVYEGDYSLDVINLNDRQASGSQARRSCGADGTITNLTSDDMLVAVFRDSNNGTSDVNIYQRWELRGYRTVQPGETIEYTGFYHCTGGPCGSGQWYHAVKISLLYKTPECLQYTFDHEEKIPESIIEIDNPCGW